MPHIETIHKTCFVCHKSSEQNKIASPVHPGTAGPSGIVELDGRPEELTEIVLRNCLEVCPHCGYIAEDIGEKTSIAREFLQSPDYRSLRSPEIPTSPSLYLRAALVRLAENNPEKAIEYYISAAWCADSLLDMELAVSCRRKALSLVFADNKTFADIPPEKWVRILDTMRRCGDFDSVIAHCTELLAIAGPALRQELEYELSCAKRGDSKPHTNLDVVNSNRYGSGPQNAGDEFIIDGKSYSVEDDCHGKGWNWVAETRTLVLANYHGTAIHATGDIAIRLEQIDNWIDSAHGPGIHIHQGNLKLSGTMFLSINGDEGGIFVDEGTLEIAGAFLKIRTKEYGIFASGTITFTDCCVIDVRSETTAIKSVSSGLNASKPVLKIFGMDAGIDIAGDFNQNEGLQRIESPNGCGILSRHGSLALTGCDIDFICGDACIRLENGNLSTRMMHGTMNGTSCVQVNGSCSIIGSNITFSGEDTGLFVSKDMEISYSKCESSGKNAISVEGNLLIQNVNLSASGGMGISVGGDLKCAGGILMLQGDTAMEISGDAEISNGLIMGVGKISGIVVNGSYCQSGGDVSFSGGAEDGMRVSGKEMRINASGSLKVSGRNSGLDVEGDVALENVVLLSASGNIGFSCTSLKLIKNVNMKATGEEIGLSVRGGNLIFGDTVTVNATGNVGIYTTGDISLHAGALQVTGQFAGIVMESGNLMITDGAIDIFGDEFGVLLQSGSMEVFSGIIGITNSRMTDSGGCGIAVEKGNLAAGSIMTINGESYAISVPCGEIFVRRGIIEAYGFRAGITGKSMKLSDAALTAYGKTEGAVVLSEHGPWNDEGVIVMAGKSTKSVTDTVYSGQKFVHVYTVHPPDAS